MTIQPFELLTAPRIVFGRGAASRLGEIASSLGGRALLVLGSASAERSGLAATLRATLPVAAEARCAGEPRLEDVERAVAAGRQGRCDVVVAVGGGAVIDCGKAAAGMLTNGGALVDYLEGVGTGRAIATPPLPFVAAPTTAGTGSEVTKNAVVTGPGWKKSVRSPLLIPRVALVDPALTHGAPRTVTAACGMDALTQLVESYLSRGATPVTDALALEGVEAAGRSLGLVDESPDDEAARDDMALASLLGGICLANAGLGAVHGIAAPLGSLYGVAHGLACAALLPQVLRANLEAAPPGSQAARLVTRVARLGEALAGRPWPTEADGVAAALESLESLQRRLEIPRLSALGVARENLPALVARSRGSSMRWNPVDLTDEQIEAILLGAL